MRGLYSSFNSSELNEIKEAALDLIQDPATMGGINVAQTIHAALVHVYGDECFTPGVFDGLAFSETPLAPTPNLIKLAQFMARLTQLVTAITNIDAEQVGEYLDVLTHDVCIRIVCRAQSYANALALANLFVPETSIGVDSVFTLKRRTALLANLNQLESHGITPASPITACLFKSLADPVERKEFADLVAKLKLAPPSRSAIKAGELWRPDCVGQATWTTIDTERGASVFSFQFLSAFGSLLFSDGLGASVPSPVPAPNVPAPNVPAPPRLPPNHPNHPNYPIYQYNVPPGGAAPASASPPSAAAPSAPPVAGGQMRTAAVQESGLIPDARARLQAAVAERHARLAEVRSNMETLAAVAREEPLEPTLVPAPEFGFAAVAIVPSQPPRPNDHEWYAELEVARGSLCQFGVSKNVVFTEHNGVGDVVGGIAYCSQRNIVFRNGHTTACFPRSDESSAQVVVGCTVKAIDASRTQVSFTCNGVKASFPFEIDVPVSELYWGISGMPGVHGTLAIATGQSGSTGVFKHRGVAGEPVEMAPQRPVAPRWTPPQWDRRWPRAVAADAVPAGAGATTTANDREAAFFAAMCRGGGTR